MFPLVAIGAALITGVALASSAGSQASAQSVRRPRERSPEQMGANPAVAVIETEERGGQTTVRRVSLVEAVGKFLI